MMNVAKRFLLYPFRYVIESVKQMLQDNEPPFQFWSETKESLQKLKSRKNS